jgi:hypothetical protein
LKTLDVSHTRVRELPREIGKLQHMKTLNVTHTRVRELPWLLSNSVSVLAGNKYPAKAGKLSNNDLSVLRHLDEDTILSSLVKPGEDLTIILYDHSYQLLPVAGLKIVGRHMRVPEWVKQHLASVSTMDIRLCKLEDDDLEFLRTMPNLQLLALRLLYLPREPTVFAGTWFSRLESFCLDGHRGHMRVPGWVKQHFANVSSLDIRLCQLGDDDLDFLRNKMPNLQLLTLRLEVLPTRKPIFITGEGFLMLKSFCLDCRLPMVTFQQGAMPKLEHLEFKFYTSRALTIEDPVGIRHLLSLKRVVFQSSPRYKSNAPDISVVINKVREEAKEHPNKITISINGKDEEVIQEKKEATKTTSASDMISEENIVTSSDAGGSSGASMIKTSLPSPYDNGSDDEKGSIIPVKSYYPFGVAK